MESDYSPKPKFASGQRVKIVSERDLRGRLRHPEIQQYEAKTGVIIDSFGAGAIPRASESYFFYDVRLDEDGTEVSVWEDSLVPLED